MSTKLNKAAKQAAETQKIEAEKQNAVIREREAAEKIAETPTPHQTADLTSSARNATAEANAATAEANAAAAATQMLDASPSGLNQTVERADHLPGADIESPEANSDEVFEGEDETEEQEAESRDLNASFKAVLANLDTATNTSTSIVDVAVTNESSFVVTVEQCMKYCKKWILGSARGSYVSVLNAAAAAALAPGDTSFHICKDNICVHIINGLVSSGTRNIKILVHRMIYDEASNTITTSVLHCVTYWGQYDDNENSAAFLKLIAKGNVTTGARISVTISSSHPNTLATSGLLIANIQGVFQSPITKLPLLSLIKAQKSFISGFSAYYPGCKVRVLKCHDYTEKVKLEVWPHGEDIVAGCYPAILWMEVSNTNRFGKKTPGINSILNISHVLCVVKDRVGDNKITYRQIEIRLQNTWGRMEIVNN